MLEYDKIDNMRYELKAKKSRYNIIASRGKKSSGVLRRLAREIRNLENLLNMYDKKLDYFKKICYKISAREIRNLENLLDMYKRD